DPSGVEKRLCHLTRPEMGLRNKDPMIRKYIETKDGREGVRYTEAFKRAVIEEYLHGTATKKELSEKHGIRGKGAFQSWMRELGYVDIRMLAAPVKASVTMPMSRSDEQDINALRKRIKELERELDDEKLRSEAYARLIELAEREQGIRIRKKDSTK